MWIEKYFLEIIRMAFVDKVDMSLNHETQNSPEQP